MKLTDKEEKFCQLVVDLGNQSEAYRQAYDVSDPSAEWIGVNASQLMASTKISLRVDQIRKDIELRRKISRETIAEQYWELWQDYLKLKDPLKAEKLKKSDKDKIYAAANSGMLNGATAKSALDSLAKMLGYDKPEGKEEGDTTINNFNFKIGGIDE